jgi:release factor glutamine methyltransferase
MPQTILADFMHRAEARLKAAGVDNPTLDVRLLMAHALDMDRAQLLIKSQHMLTEVEQERISALLTRRANREPVSRILGEREFWSLRFSLNEATLVPRPDSETLIEATLRLLSSLDDDTELRILDLGTGTGCLLLSLLHEFQNATGLGIDKVPRAVGQAEDNAERLGFTSRAKFRTGNWADGIDEKFDIIISNPPYIARSEIGTLMPEVCNHDPHLALDGGDDGLDVYRLLIPQLTRLLKPKGLAVFEIGEGQGAKVGELFRKAALTNITLHFDLAGIQRCITANHD